METEKWIFFIIQDIRLYPPNEYTNNRMKNNHQELNGLHPILIACHKKIRNLSFSDFENNY